MEARPDTKAGLTLVELLAVLSIIGMISVVAIPVLARSGLFTSTKADLAARELFTVLRAAKLYATTYNVETAVAYGGVLVEDSFSREIVPVVDSVAVVRRLSREELDAYRLPTSPNARIYVPLRTRGGVFSRLPNGTCILPDLFEVDVNLPVRPSATGLHVAWIFDPDAGEFIEPREDYDIHDSANQRRRVFPVHRFSPEGSVIPPDNFTKQRISIRVGILPDADISDRFFREPEGAPQEPIPIVFSAADEYILLREPGMGDPIDIDVEIALYVATGRVKVES